SISPNTPGPFTGGQTVTISGQRFLPQATVRFGPNPASSISFVSSTQLSVVVPPGVGTVDVSVVGANGTATAAAAYTYNPAPDVQYFSWFDRASSPGFAADNIHVINPGAGAANVSVSIPRCATQSGTIAAGG